MKQALKSNSVHEILVRLQSSSYECDVKLNQHCRLQVKFGRFPGTSGIPAIYHSISQKIHKSAGALFKSTLSAPLPQRTQERLDREAAMQTAAERLAACKARQEQLLIEEQLLRGAMPGGGCEKGRGGA
ncbi:hypothetical protein L208DRAFT_147173 [Tricholoma matsutake]|nr:hypothetical protein L208DRAFT_147173 [Tricholoma matsutake 945]